MHVATAVIAFIATLRFGDWRNWKKYHATILFIALGNLLYNFLTSNYFLWRLHADFISNHTLTEMLYTFIVFPCTILMFLHNYPTDAFGKTIRTLKWIMIYGIWEWFFVLTGRIQYQYGWSLWWSIAFLFVMFPLLRLHQKHPLLTYILSAIVAIAVLWWFKVPVHLPVEDRS
ncbi:hypothetical protein SAMN05660297_03218 [Natronincola peptidivorans]|uniref:Uncharacterized protein n=1 Tax=Natronincola peptidivorans TaxID=426128 RepID=A0A1I0GI14_9FIRM|nr:CBO0543 family protein [Natronincola peptidivorans]SET70536.1 hypothetical protein SAMN05660297_03218 [Natronincola peptidivorans]